MPKGMSLPFSRVAGLILGVLTLLIASQVISAIYTEGLNPNSNKLKNAIGSFGGNKVHIGLEKEGKPQGDNPVTTDDYQAEAEFRGLVAFNMLSAVNCNYLALIYDEVDKNSNVVTHFGEVIDEDYKYDNPLEAFIQGTSHNGVCYGTNELPLPEIPEGGVEAVGMTLERIEDLFTCSENQPANDMDGRHGKINFEIHKEFTIGNHNDCNLEELRDGKANCPEILMKLNPNEQFDQFESGFWGGNCHPNFLQGHRASAFLPSGLHTAGNQWYGDEKLYTVAADNEPVKHSHLESTCTYTTTNSHGVSTYHEGDCWDSMDWVDGEHRIKKMYTYRIKMHNVPKTIPADMSLTKINEDEYKYRWDIFYDRIKYHLCEGSRGVIQTNAKTMRGGEPAGGETSKKENAVFTEVKIKSGKLPEDPRECIKRGEQIENPPMKFKGWEIPLKNEYDEPLEENDVVLKGAVDEDDIAERLDCSRFNAGSELEVDGMLNPRCYYKKINEIKFKTTDEECDTYGGDCETETVDRFDGEVENVYRPGWFVPCIEKKDLFTYESENGDSKMYLKGDSEIIEDGGDRNVRVPPTGWVNWNLKRFDVYNLTLQADLENISEDGGEPDHIEIAAEGSMGEDEGGVVNVTREELEFYGIGNMYGDNPEKVIVERPKDDEGNVEKEIGEIAVKVNEEGLHIGYSKDGSEIDWKVQNKGVTPEEMHGLHVIPESYDSYSGESTEATITEATAYLNTRCD